MRLSASIQLLLVALTAQSAASPVAAPPSVDVASRDFTELSTDTAAIQKRSFQKSCENERLTGQDNRDPKLYADCRAPSGAMIQTSLSLNKCIANRNGVIKWSKELVPPTYLLSLGPSGPIITAAANDPCPLPFSGNFGRSCHSVFFQIHPNTLMATCSRPDGSQHTSELNWGEYFWMLPEPL